MNSLFLVLALGLSCGLITVSDAAQAAPDLLGKTSWALLRPTGAADLTTVGQILHVTVHKAATPYYQIELTHDVAAGVPAGTTIRYHFWARSSTSIPIHAVVEKRTAPYTHLLDKYITLAPAWKEYAFAVVVPTAYAAQGLAARLQLGLQAGATDFKGVTLTPATH